MEVKSLFGIFWIFYLFALAALYELFAADYSTAFIIAVLGVLVYVTMSPKA